VWKRLVVVLGVSVCAAIGGARPYHAQQPPKVDFVRDVQPILREHCYECHGPKQQKNNFRLDRRKDAFRGGTQTVLGPGNAEGSKLYQRLIGSEFGRRMPPDDPMSRAQVDTIKAWIDGGAEWPDAAAGEVKLPPPDRGAAALMDALRVGDRAAFQNLLARNHRAAKRRGPNGATPLMYAALYSDLATLRTLLDKGADPNISDHAGATALMWAVDDLAKAELLVRRGANVNAKSADGRTPLMLAAARRGGTPVVRLLLDRGADMTVKGTRDTTAFLQSFASGDESTIDLLLERGADIKTATLGSFGAALRAECDGCAAKVFPHLSPDAITGGLTGAMPPGASGGRARRMLDAGADPHAKGFGGRTALMLAAASDDVLEETVATLIERGADVNAKSPAGETALTMARLRGDTAVTRLLMRAGARDDGPLAAAPASFAPAASARAAVERSLPLLQEADVTFLTKSGCVSCHHNSLTAMTVAAARVSGINVNDAIARQQAVETAAYLDRWRDRVLQGIGIAGASDTINYILVGLAAERYPGDASTDAMARYLLSQQAPSGAWHLVAHRPPMESSDIEVTAMSMRAMQMYAPPSRRAEYQPAIDRAAAWIATAKPVVNEDHVFQILGLHWSGASAAAIQERARALLAQQRQDGGWAQLPTLESDAYATGQALVALVESGALPVTDPAYARGAEFLLKTQFADGSWFVRSRSLPIQPHFESGFPFGRDQFISAAGTNWAAMALTLGVKSGSSSRPPPLR
jgi:ankyrin repeat protein